MRNSDLCAIHSDRALALLGTAALICAACGNGPSAERAVDANTAAVEPCRAFDSYTAAIAERTIECQRTIGPESFRIDTTGSLVRAFDRCASGQTDALRDIDGLLSVQRRDLPDAQRCIAGHFRDWATEFATRGIRARPTWEKLETYGAPTKARLEAHVAAFGASTGNASAVADQHENHLYRVTHAVDAEPSALEPAATAAACAGGFAGFVLEAEGDHVLGDPALWLSGYVYPAGANPFLEAAGYCHRMSLFGPLPGNIYAHRNRVGECCTRFDGTTHVALRLELDCLDTAGIDCVAVCI